MDILETVVLIEVLSLVVVLLFRRVRRATSRGEECSGSCSDCHRGPAAALAPIVGGLLLLAGPARAADTVETWDVGATDVDMYLGVDGVGQGDPAQMVTFGEIMLGYGLVERLSAHVGVRFESNEYFTEGETVFSLGLFGTPLDTEHFDLDLFLLLSGGGAEIEIAPSIELNLDSHPNMRGAGLYLRTGVSIHGHQVAEGDADPRYLVAPRFELTVGVYYTIAGGHQLLVEHDLSADHEPVGDERWFEVGGFAFGYNVALGSSLELINQLCIEVPQASETTAVGFMTGLIATLPSAR